MELSLVVKYSQPTGRDLMLMYVAGAGSSAAFWPDSLMKKVGPTAMAHDLPGHGENVGPARRRVIDYANHMAALIPTLNAPQVILIGHSMGAAIALAVAHQHPGLVASLVLIGAASRLPVAPALFHQLTTDFAGAAQFVARYGYHPSADPTLPAACIDQLLQTGSLVTTGDFLACDQFDARSWLFTVTCPTLVMIGEADKLVRPSEASALAAALPNGRFLSIPDAGHFVMQEQPDAVGAAMSAFLTGR